MPVSTEPFRNAPQFLDGSSYVNHVELLRKSRGVEMPEKFWTDPLMYQGCSQFLGPDDDIKVTPWDKNYGIDIEAEVAVIVSDVPLGTTTKEAPEYIEYVTIINDVSLRNLIPDELAKGFGFVHGKPQSSMAPLAQTPEELGEIWYDNKLDAEMHCYINDNPALINMQKTRAPLLIGTPDCNVDMVFDFAQLISHAAKTRNLISGTVIGSGTVSNKGAPKGVSCIAELRMLETLRLKAATTPYLKSYETIRIEAIHKDKNLFGSIKQQVIPWVPTYRY